MDAVNDGATLQILYKGKTADTALNEKRAFDQAFEDLFRERSEEELLAIKRKYGSTGDILEAENRINAIARDLVNHYVDNFCRGFDLDDPDRENTGIAFLIVCDRLLTGFDAPIEQVMYIDKKLREHTLLQAIARTNRVEKGKQRGYIVDYEGREAACGLRGLPEEVADDP